MKSYLMIFIAFIALSGNAQIRTIGPGAIAPDFRLKNVDGELVSPGDYPEAKGFIVVFTCNTCPVSMAYEQRIIELDNKLKNLGYPVIAINPNDPALSAGDSFIRMQERARSKKYPFPYLFDEGQTITNLYGATKTPHLFVAQKTDKGLIVQYTGAIDDDQEEGSENRNRYVEDAVKALNDNKLPAVSSTKAIGCTVKRAL